MSESTSQSPADSGVKPIRAAMIRTLILQLRSQTAAGMVVAGLTVGVAWAYNPPWLIVLWTAGVLASVFFRASIGWAFQRRPQPDEAMPGWGRLYIVAMTMIGTSYGVAFLLFAHPDQPVTVALLLAPIYSVAAGSTPSCAYQPRAILGAVIPSFAAVLGKLLWTGDFEYILLGSASALYGVTMIGYCRVQSRALEDGFRIRFENTELVEQLRRETVAAEEARQSAEQANLAKSQFLAAASHDLRQPLYALGLFSSSLEELKLDSGGRDVVRRIQDSIGTMESSFEGLLDLSKLDAGAVTPRLEPVSVDALFDRIDQIFGPLALERGLELRLRSDGERVTSDAVLLEQVISNLVSNAIRATKAGGVLLAARRRSDALVFEIWDTGSGIAASDVERIFGDYVQLDNPERDRRRGLGLGLAIARRSVALLGACIDVASRPGRGSRFRFAQPLCDDDRTAPVDHAAMPIANLRRDSGPLLIVEDDEDVRAALGNLLRRWDIAFEAEATADAGLERLLGGQQFSLLITDQRLAGGMTGLDLIRAMRMQVADPPPAIIITGEVDSPLLTAAMQEKILVLHKPVRSNQLRRLLISQTEIKGNANGR